MTDQDIILRIVDLDRSAVELPSWEAGFCESMVRKFERGAFVLTEKQRECALRVLTEFEGIFHPDAGQDVTYKLPPGKERYFKKP